ncbi:ArsA-related P-loop ATPase [Bdellovibrionota bacterium FG-2]
MNLDQILDQRKIIITCGTGGVGKTTVSAALALRCALRGYKTLVITIDPAKRLVTSLGLKELGDKPTDLSSLISSLKISTTVSKGAPLYALMPDTRSTFESFVNNLSSDPTVAERVMRNPIYQIFAKEFSGTNEFMALERLWSLWSQGEYDRIILDTPPSRNTLTFLEAPKLLGKFFDENFIRWLVLPTNKIISQTMKRALSILEKLTGTGFMSSLFDFASALFEIRARFSANLKRIMELLGSENVGFIMITTPTPEAVPEVALFIDNLKKNQFQFDGMTLNRTLSQLNSELPPGAAPESEATAVIRSLQNRETHIIERLKKEGIPICAILPELARDIHSLEDLAHVAMALVPDTPI